MTAGTWLAVGVLALLSGTLLRLSLELGVPALRMLSFWCLVGVGLLAARAAGRAQEEEGRRELLASLAGLGEDYAQVRETAFGQGTLAVVGPGGVAVLVADGMAQYGRGPLVRRRLERAGARARAAAAAVAAAAGARGLAVPVRPAVVFLRRRLRPAEAELVAVPVLNPEAAAEWVKESVGRGGELAPEERRRLAEALREDRAA